MATMTDLEKKRAVKEERLQSHYETYLQDSNTRRSQNARVADPSESVDTFLATFSQRRDKARALFPMSGMIRATSVKCCGETLT